MNQNQKSSILLNVPARVFFFFSFFLFFFLFKPQASFAQYQKTQKAVYEKMGSYINAYYESLPADYAANPTKKYPLLIFIHGKGELGNGSSSQLPLVLRNGPPKLLNQGIFPSSFSVGGQSHSFIVISPQINTYDYALSTAFVTQMLTYCQSKYRIDESRIYITGLSMGGLIGWRFVGDNQANADKIAAGVFVCSGASNTASRIKNIATSKLPVWLTNNSGDPAISAASATAAVAALNAFTPPPPKAVLSIFNASGHDAWTKTYDPNFKQDGLNIYEWMLSYKRGTSASQPPVTSPAPVLKSNAGGNQTITLPTNSTTLDGTKSTYPSGSTFLWVKGEGPAGGTIVSPTSLKTSITGLTAGDYRFQLRITDKNGNLSSSSMHVIVNPAPAAAGTTLKSNAGGNQTITLPTNSTTIDGTKSTYPSGSTFLWVKGEGPAGGTIVSPTSLKTSVTGLTAGDYRFQLRITDKNGNLSSSSMHVIVNPAPASAGTGTTLKSNAGGNQTITLPTNSTTIDGTKSTYPSGSTFLWRKVIGPAGGTIVSSTSLKTAITGLNTAGDYQFQLRITDKAGNLSTSSMHVIVNPAPASTGTSALKSVAGTSQTITQPTSSVTLDGTGSSGPEGLTHVWKQTGGPKTAVIGSIYSIKTTVTGLTVAGTYSFQLELKDPKGNTAVSTVNIIVNAAASSLLNAVAGSNQTITLPTSSVTLDGTGSSGPVGLTHLWKQTGGPKTAVIGSIYSIKTTVTGLTVAGTYSFQLELKDPSGKIATSTVQIIVNNAAGSGGVAFQANAGGNQTIIRPASTAVLDGTKSTWPSSSGTTHYWHQISGPVTASIPYPYSIKAEVSGLTKEGDYQFQIVLTDSKGNKSTSSTHVIVQAATSKRTSSVASVASEDVSAQSAESDVLHASPGDLNVKINPNPVQADMNVWIDGGGTGKAAVVIYNLQGQPLFQQAFLKDSPGPVSKSFNISKLPAGIYLLHANVDDKYKQTVRVVKQ